MNRGAAAAEGAGGAASARRSHHIADVAHHFLADARPAAPCVYVAGPAAAAALARELAAAWVRAARVDAALVDPTPGPAPPAAAVPGLTERAPGDPPAAGEGAVFWRLGPLDTRRLDDLEAVGRVPGAELPGAPGGRRLLWCVEPPAAAAWTPLVALGRLAGILRPPGVVLVVPAAAAGSAGETLRARAETAAACRVRILHLPPAARPGARAAALAGLPDLLDSRPG